MHQLQDLQQALGTMITLVNSSPQSSGTEELGDLDAVRQFIVARAITEVEPPTEADLASLHTLRRKLRAVFAAREVTARTALVNNILAGSTIEPRLVSHDDLGLHVHYFARYASLAEHLGADCAMTLALLLASGESERLRICSADGCARVLVDSSRNRSRTYCDSRTCGSRMHAARYRARKRSTSP